MTAVSGVMSGCSCYHDLQTEPRTMMDSFYDNDDDEQRSDNEGARLLQNCPHFEIITICKIIISGLLEQMHLCNADPFDSKLFLMDRLQN